MNRSTQFCRALGLWGVAALVALPACERDETSVDPEPAHTTATTEVVPVAWPDEPFRSERPTPKPIASVEIPTIETFTLDNGVEVFLVQQQTLPTVLMFFEWEIGETSDPKGRTGLASVCADLLDEATKTKDKASFSAAQDDHAVNVWISASSETTIMGVRALQRELGSALDLAAEMLLEPALNEDDFTRLREQHQARLEQRTGSARAVSGRLFSSLIWGSQHPYGKIETKQSLAKIELADCQRFAKQLRPKGARLWVVGKISQTELRDELGARFGKWTGKAPKRRKIGAAQPAAGTIFFVDVPGSAQSQIAMGHPGPARDAPDYEATKIMASILGGSFSSRINMNLREDKGWSYGARGSFSYTRSGSYFTAGSSVRSDVTGPALLELSKEIENMRAAPPSAEELERERNGALLAMPTLFSTATGTLFSFKGLHVHGLPLDWHTGHQERLRALDPQAVHAAAEAHLQSSGHVVLVVGDAETVLEPLEAIAKDEVFGAGGIQYLDTDGNPLSRPGN